MAPNGTASEVLAGRLVRAPARKSDSLWLEAARRFRRHRLAMIGLVVLAAMVLAVVVGPFVYRLPIDEIDFRAKLKGPSWAHPLGTDDLGQDILARILYGGRISLAVGVVAMLIGICVGTTVGAVAGQLGGALDSVLMRLTDLFLSLPQLPIFLLTVYLFRDPMKKLLGPEMGAFVLIVAVIGSLRWMPVARLVRAQFLSLREKEFVEAARALGVPTARQIIRHVLPNAIGPVIVAGSLDVATAILLESTLSFLGLGFPPDIPTWGRILFDAKDNLDFAPHWAIFPGTAIFLDGAVDQLHRGRPAGRARPEEGTVTRLGARPSPPGGKSAPSRRPTRAATRRRVNSPSPWSSARPRHSSTTSRSPRSAKASAAHRMPSNEFARHARYSAAKYARRAAGSAEDRPPVARPIRRQACPVAIRPSQLRLSTAAR